MVLTYYETAAKTSCAYGPNANFNWSKSAIAKSHNFSGAVETSSVRQVAKLRQQ